jgi:predicted membrane protein
MKKIGLGWIWGIILIAIGIGFLMDSLGYGSFQNFLKSYWPFLLVLIGLAHILYTRYFSGIAWVIIGGVLSLFTLGVVKGNAWEAFWPLVLVLIGVRILIRPKFRMEGGDDRDYASSTAVFGGAAKKITSKNFAGTNVSAIFGGAKLDLRSAQIAKEGAVIDVDAVFGGVEILVPERIKVKVDVFAAFGGHDDKRDVSKINEKGPEILIRGNAIFGGIEIKS